MVIGHSEFLLDPRSRLSINWDIAVGLLLVLTVITMPLSMAFEVTMPSHDMSMAIETMAVNTWRSLVLKEYNARIDEVAVPSPSALHSSHRSLSNLSM